MIRYSLIILLGAVACVHDVVLPSPSEGDVCGDGIVGPTEDCDNPNPGCNACKVTPGWQCVQNTCFYPCGDGISGNGPMCTNPTKDNACDMTGFWVARETDSVLDAILSEPQTASTWWLYRFSQTGDAIQVEQALHCGVHVTGSATVDLTPYTLGHLLYRNDPSVKGAHPRNGTFAAASGGCSFTFDRAYRIRGGVDSLLPADFSTHPALKDLPALPYEPDPTHPLGQHLDGAEETDTDGLPGISVQVSGATGGIRNAVQRDYKEYAGSGQANAIQFTITGDWALEENVLATSQCGQTAPAPDAGADSGLPGWCNFLTTPGNATPSLAPRVTFRFLGTTLTSPRVAAVVTSDPGVDMTADLETCANVRIALPHDPTP